jgi:ATP-dependent RNA helicase DeaD
MSDLSSLGITPPLVKALNEMGIINPTLIQSKAIPVLLTQKTDFIGQAQTGTGKTAAFGIPLIQRLNPKDQRIQAVIICPTRELCQQNAKALFKFTKYTDKIFIEAVYGGDDLQRQIAKLRRPTQILVATPGRLLELMEKKIVDLSGIHQLVLDEADEILAMGFKKDIDKILNKTNDFRKIWLFSATIPASLQEVINTYMDKETPSVRVQQKSDIINPMIEHQYVVCEKQEKPLMLVEFVKAMGSARGIVFCRTKGDAQTVAGILIEKGYAADALHGDLLQRDRDKVMRSFKSKKIQILVATDMAARGIDVDNLSYVAHFNLPDQLEFYTHRSGRTARAGKRGISLSFVTPADLRKFKFLQEKLVLDFKQVR